ncbi:hypothetical protein, partial [Saccharomonospora saliphila]|uniref:hypothetical protein n=1 Tax=Saccharomonospora saliphila TaxID=369829 RepID=UPI000662654C
MPSLLLASPALVLLRLLVSGLRAGLLRLLRLPGMLGGLLRHGLRARLLWRGRLGPRLRHTGLVLRVLLTRRLLTGWWPGPASGLL